MPDYAKNSDRPVANDSSESAVIVNKADELNKKTWDIVNKLRVVRGKLLPSRPEKGEEAVTTEQAPSNFVEKMRQIQEGQSNALDYLYRLVNELEQF